MKARAVLLGTTLLGSLGLALFGDRTPSGTADAAAQSPLVPATDRPAREADERARPALKAPGATVAAALSLPVLMDRQKLIGRDASGAQPLFTPHSWTPPAPKLPPVAEPPPTAPPLPFKYVGKAQEGDQWQVFLDNAGVLLIVQEKEVIDGRYRIEKIHPPTVTFTYLPLDQRQELTID